jgi:hypothetical protein
MFDRARHEAYRRCRAIRTAGIRPFFRRSFTELDAANEGGGLEVARDTRSAEAAEAQIDRVIERREDQRRRSEGEGGGS